MLKIMYLNKKKKKENNLEGAILDIKKKSVVD